MSLREDTIYIVICDTCGRSFGSFRGNRHTPQQVLRIAELEFGWHVDDEVTICVGCPQPTDEPEPAPDGDL